jgi:hypothetical protein
MNQREMVQRIKGQLHDCEGFEGDTIAEQRKAALDYYAQRARGDEVAGRSHVVSGDLSAMVEANLAQMLDAFDSDSIAYFDAVGEEDEDQAQLETATVQYFVMSKGNGFLPLASAIKDALLVRNGIVCVDVETHTETSTRSYSHVRPEAFAALLHQPNTKAETISFDPKTGKAKIRFTTERKRFVIEAVALEDFLYLKNWNSPYLQDIPFCARRRIEPRSELLRRGFPKDKVARLKSIRNVGPQAAARNVRSDTQLSRGIDESQELIEWFECYAMMDAGDGISERHRVSVSGQELLEDVPMPLVPFCNGIAILNPHRFVGISLYDKLKQVQDITTGLERALLDNVNTTNKNRTAYLDNKVNVDDINNGRTNGSIRVKGVQDVRAAVTAFTIPDTSVGILANLQHQQARRTELGGAALDLASGAMQLNDRVGSQGLDRAYSVMEMLAAMMTKLCAHTLIRSVYLLAHAQLREKWNMPAPVKRTGRWISPLPAKWQARECCTVKVGMSPGERARRVTMSREMLQTQLALVDKGMEDILVNVDGFYALLMDMARWGDMENPEQYFVDPRSDAAKEAMAAKSAAAQRNAQMQQALMQQAIGLEQLGRALEKYKADQETQFKYWRETLLAEVEEAKIAGAATTELLKQKKEGESRANGSGKPSTGKGAQGQSAGRGNSGGASASKSR